MNREFDIELLDLEDLEECCLTSEIGFEMAEFHFTPPPRGTPIPTLELIDNLRYI